MRALERGGRLDRRRSRHAAGARAAEHVGRRPVPEGEPEQGPAGWPEPETPAEGAGGAGALRRAEAALRSAPGARAVWRAGGAWAFLGLELILSLGYLLEVSVLAADLCALASGLATVLALVVGIRRNRPPVTSAWWLLCCAVVLFLVGGAMRVLLGSSPVALVPDSISSVGYVALALALAMMMSSAKGRLDVGAVVDGLLVGTAAMVFSYIYLVVPALGVDPHPGSAVFDGVFPVLDVIVVVLVAQMAFGGASRLASTWLAAGAAMAMLVGDVGWDLRAAQRVSFSDWQLDAPFLLAFALLGSAALHPSMRRLGLPGAGGRPLGPVRLAMVTSSLLAPALLSVAVQPRQVSSRVVQGVGVFLVGTAALWRTARAVNAQARSERAFAYRATHDPLTGVANRDLLVEVLDGALSGLRHTQHLAVLFVDLDEFKLVNDSWGHQAGDELLLDVSKRLLACVPDDATVARVSGDEFVLAVPGATVGAAEELAREILRVLQRPSRLATGSMVVSASIGVVGLEDYPPGAPPTSAALLRDADVAMYRAKRSGRACVARFDPAPRERGARRLHTELALRKAILEDGLETHYQPLVSLLSGDVVGFEALVRWPRPEVGLVEPGDFIGLAEDTGLIVPLGARVLTSATAQLGAWLRRYPAAPEMHVAVNVSSRQLRDPALARRVADALRRSGLRPQQLWLEITESIMVEDSPSTAAALAELHEIGVVVAIDDFGTGYSALGYLKSLRAGVVKIDRSFVADLCSDPGDEAIISAVISMAGALGLRTVAEGVETREQAERLCQLGCELAQGWLFGRPAKTLPGAPPPALSARRSSPRR